MILVDVIRYTPPQNPSYLAPYFNLGHPPSFSFSSSREFATLSYSFFRSGFSTLLVFSLPELGSGVTSESDPRVTSESDPSSTSQNNPSSTSQNNPSSTSQNPTSLRYALFQSPANQLLASLPSLLSPAAVAGYVSLFGTAVPDEHAITFAAEIRGKGMVEITAVMTEAPNIPHLREAVNFNATSTWLAQLRGFVGVKEQVMSRIRNIPYSESIRTCRAAMQAAVPGEFHSNTTVLFWRESFQWVEITRNHNELWHLFLSDKKLDYYMTLEDVVELEKQYASISKSPLIIAIPVLELVSCRFELTEQPFWKNSVMRSKLVRTSDSMLSHSAIAEIDFDETSTMHPLGSVAVALSVDTAFLTNTLSGFSQRSTRHRRLDASAELLSDSPPLSDSPLSQQPTPRRLLDSYGESLVFTSLQLTRLFGSVGGSVPAHMPHLINKSVMGDIEVKLSQYVNETVRHRFRENDDLQYAFLYFHYLEGIEQAKYKDNLLRIWAQHLDTDGDGVLSTNEFNTLCSVVLEENTEKCEIGAISDT